MSKIVKFDNANLNQMRTAIEAALAPVNEKFGTEIKIGTFRYDREGTNFKTQLDVTIAGIGKKDYSELYPWLKLPKLGTRFMHNGRRFTVTEHAPSRPKYPVIADDENGKRFKFASEAVNERTVVTE